MNIMNEISFLETELESLRAENKVLKEFKIVADFEIDQLKRRLAVTEQQREAHLTARTHLKAILDQAGQHLVQGIARYHEDMRLTEEKKMLSTTVGAE